MECVCISTSVGKILIKLLAKHAPKSVEYFSSLIKSDAYKNGHFYRVVHKSDDASKKPTINLLQGGVGWDSVDELPTIKLESTDVTGLKHKYGIISLAQGIPGISAAEFFICIGDCPALDFGETEGKGSRGFAAFGEVIEGMDIVEKIHNMPANSLPPDGDERFKNEFLDENIYFDSIEIVTQE